MASTTFVDGITVINASWLNEVNRSVYSDVINVKNAPYNAVGDGVTDDSAAIIAAITAACATLRPTTVYFPSATYKCNSVLGSFTGSNITIDFGGSTLDFSGVSAASTATLLIFEGSYSTGVTLSSLAAANQKTVSAPSTGFAAGDFVRIYSEKIWDSTRTSTKYGELNFIKSVPNGVSVELTMELQSSYATADTAKIEKLIPIQNVIIRNGTIIGPTANDETRGIRFRLGINCHLHKISSYDVDYLHAQLTDCIDCSVTSCLFQESNHSSTAYGLSFADASCDCIAYGNFFIDVRHSLSTNNNTTTSYGITRRIRFELNSIRDSAPATGGSGGDAIDTHAGSEDIDIVNNTIHSSSNSGINVEGRSARIQGNRIKHTVSVGIYFHPYSDEVPNVQISGNRCNSIGDGSGTDPAIFVSVGAVAPSRVHIVDNVVESSTSEAVRVFGTAGSTLRYLTLTGNTLRSDTGTSVVYLRYISVGNISGNTCVGAAAVTGLLIEDCSIMNVSGANSFEIGGTATNGYTIRLIGTGSRCQLVGNTGYANGTFTNTFGVHFADTITNSGVYCNVFPGVTTDVTLGAGAGNAQANNA